ncbi:glycoside hydrolase family 31 protein [Athelia psychrophila]|uniref:Glycoside hydrolase family 31 protein n=1 Tax=Athelia psychrophila TaxID=1759441 RepID=A0A167T6U8_9AGAM|nr:glycoside hydrolase family 31 protein [Fibularhizoctonia sp. CBS 109695]
MQAAFLPFFCSHNTVGAIGQEPYRWDSVADASRIAISARYAVLLLHSTPFYTTEETKPKPFALLVSISEVTTSAAGSGILDDGISLSTSSLDIAFTASKGSVKGAVRTSSYKSARPLSNITVLYIHSKTAYLFNFK